MDCIATDFSDRLKYSKHGYWMTKFQSDFFIRENYEITGLFLISAFVVYFAPSLIIRLYFLFLLFQYYKSSRDYFWMAFAFILVNTPGGIFSGSTYSDVNRLPIYPIAPGMSLSFFDLFFSVSILKALNISNKSTSGYYFSKSLTVIVIYGLFLLIYSFILGMPLQYLIQIIGRNVILPFFFFLIAPRLIPDTDSLFAFFKLILPFIILSFLGQIYSIIQGEQFINLIKPSEVATLNQSSDNLKEVIRFFDSAMLNALSIIFCSFFLISGVRIFKPIFYILFLSMSFFICYSSATRGWFLAFSTLLISLLIFNIRWSNPVLRKYSVLLVLVFFTGYLLIKQSTRLTTQIDLASERLKTISLIAKGDVTAGGTNARLDIRTPRVINKFLESPLIGWGFSYEGYRFSDGHVGIPNMLLEGGITGFILFTYMLIQICLLPYNLSRNKLVPLQTRSALKFIPIAVLALIIIHSSSTQLFGYNTGFGTTEKWFMLAIILTGFNVFYRKIYSETYIGST